MRARARAFIQLDPQFITTEGATSAFLFLVIRLSPPPSVFSTFTQPLPSGSDSIWSTCPGEKRVDSCCLRRTGGRACAQPTPDERPVIDRKLGAAGPEYPPLGSVGPFRKWKTRAGNEADECIRCIFVFLRKWDESGLYRGTQQLCDAAADVFSLCLFPQNEVTSCGVHAG